MRFSGCVTCELTFTHARTHTHTYSIDPFQRGLTQGARLYRMLSQL